MPTSTPVKFDRPPVVEVACGILFGTTVPLRAAHIGLYWQRIRNEFPRIEEAPPLSPVIETEAGVGIDFGPRVFGPLPPLRRTWLVSDDGRNLIQVQDDRFLFNWKKAAEDDRYPSYEQVIERFNRHLAGFLEFLKSEDIGAPVYRQFELTYFNHIALGPTAGIDVNENRLLVDHVRDTARERFLPEPEAVNWVSLYSWPNKPGRLYAAAQSGVSPDGRRILKLDMTARGIPADPSEESRQAWFDQAHIWITHGFADLSDKVIQELVWRRIG
jgi:uncharacterized protein (TIGR04255 family)